MRKPTVSAFITLAIAFGGSAAQARSFTFDAPVAVESTWTDTPTVMVDVGPDPPALVRAELAGWEIALERDGDGTYSGAFALGPVPLPPGTYTITFHAEDADGEATPFTQRLSLAAPAGDDTPWLPGSRTTGGPLPVEVLGTTTFETGQAWDVPVRIAGAARPERFEALLAGYRADFVNQGDYRYDARFDAPWLLPPGDYTLRVEAEDQDGVETVHESMITLTAPSDGSTPWLAPVAPTVWEAPPLDFTDTVGGEPATGCAGGGAGGTALALATLLLWTFGRRRWVALVAALLITTGCGPESAETRAVGRGEALVEVVDAGDGFTNVAPLWPLALGARSTGAAGGVERSLVPGGQGRRWITETWPTRGGRGMILRALQGAYDWLELVETEDGVYVTASARGGRLSRPLFALPATVRVGMTWRTWARPGDLGRLDLWPGEVVDDSGGYELRVTRVVEDHDAPTARGRARVWEITWKGPLTPSATKDWLRDAPRVPSRGVMRFVEGYGPTDDSPWLVPAVSYGAYTATRLNDAADPIPTGALVLPEPTEDLADGPRVTLSAVPLPESLERTGIHQLSALELSDGLWLRFDGNAAGLGYPSAFPGSGGGGGNANLWVASATTSCFRLDAGALVSGQELGLLADDETCVHAAASVVSPDGADAFTVPFVSYFGAPVPRNVVEGCDEPGCLIGVWPLAVLPGDAPDDVALLAQHDGGGWSLHRWRELTWQERHQLNDLEEIDPIDGAALDALLATTVWSGSTPSPALVAERLDDGGHGLLRRGATRYGHPSSFGFARLDPSGASRAPVDYGPVGFGTSFRAGPSGHEVWQVDGGGRVWEWRFTAAGMERRVRARLELPADATATAVVRLDAARLFVVTAGPEPDDVPTTTARLACGAEYCWEQPHPATARLWTAPLPAVDSASPWERPPAVQGVTVSEDGRTVCGPYTDAPPTLVDAPAGVTAAPEDDGRCLVLDTAAATAPVEAFTARLAGTPPLRVIPADPIAAGAVPRE